MCGIVAGKNLTEVQTKVYLKKLEHRGDDSFGAIQINQNITTTKAMNLNKLDLNPKNDFVIAHNRWASVGGVNLELAHPIVKNDVAIIHNGTKKPIKEIFSKDIESDTQGILELFLNISNLDTITNIINSAGVIFLIRLTDGKLFFHRDETRPLMINKDRTLIASEPVEGGEWSLIKEQDKLFNSFEEFLKEVETYNFVNCDDIELKSSNYHYSYASNFNTNKKCVTCKKTHFLDDNDQCPACKSKGIKAPKKNTHTPTNVYKKEDEKFPLNTLVHLNNNPNIYRVIREDEGLYHLMRIDSNKIVYYQPKKIIKPLSPNHLIEGEYYQFTDSEIMTASKREYKGKSNNSNYNYRVKVSNLSFTVYKYVLWETNIKLKLS